MFIVRKPADKISRPQYSPQDFKKIRGSCVATTISQANRIVGRIYEEAFRDVGISSPQFALLVALVIKPDATAGELATELSADPSTVSRNTELLIKRGLISPVPCSADKRVRRYCLSEEGHATVQSCVPMWKHAQRTALKKIGRGSWQDVLHALRRLAL